MSKKITPDVGPLSHHPFAALQGKVKPAPSERGPVDDTRESASSAPADPPSTTSPGAPTFRTTGKLVVKMERKGHGGKTVTRVSGVHAADALALARALKKALGTGVHVDDDGTLTVQGDLVERVARWLEEKGATRVVRGT